MTGVAVLSAPSSEFDLSPYREAIRQRNAPAARFLFLVGLAFVGAGVVLGAYISTQSPGVPTWQTFAVVVGAFTVGAMVMWLPVLVARPWRWPRTLRIEDSGFTLVDSSGRAEAHPWEEPGLAIAIREPLSVSSGPANVSPAEFLEVAPGGREALIPGSARERLMDAAARHGLTMAQESYVGPGLTKRAEPGPVREWIAVREPFGVTPPTQSWKAPAEPGPADGFDLVTGKLSTDAIGFTTPPRRLASIFVSEAGLEVRKVNGTVVRYDWGSPKLRIRLLRRLESVATPLSAPDATWGLELVGPRLSGEVSGLCRSAILASASARHLRCPTLRFCLPDRPSWRWLASTLIQPATASR